MSGRKPSKAPAPALSGTLDLIRKGRAGNEALEELFADQEASDEQAGQQADALESTEAAAAELANGVPPGANVSTRQHAGTEAQRGDETAASTPDSASTAAANGTGTAAVAPVHLTATGPELAQTAPAEEPKTAASANASANASAKRARSATPTAAGEPRSGRRARPGGVPFTVLLNRDLRAKVQSWTLANRRKRRRPSNIELLTAAATRWRPERAGEFLDWFDHYEPIGMATPDASRFSARVPPELVERLEVVCAELAVQYDLRIPRQALMMFLLDEELTTRLNRDG